MIDIKLLNEAERKAAYKQMAQEIGDDMFFTKKELNYLPEIMTSGEMLVSFCSGMMSGNTWLIALTNKRILFVDKGLLFGLKQQSIDLDKVNSFSIKTGMLFATIFIQDSAATSEITNVTKKSAAYFSKKIHEIIEQRKNPTISNNSPKPSPIEMIEKLSVLRDKGIISDSEFQIKKTELMEQI